MNCRDEADWPDGPLGPSSSSTVPYYTNSNFTRNPNTISLQQQQQQQPPSFLLRVVAASQGGEGDTHTRNARTVRGTRPSGSAMAGRMSEKYTKEKRDTPSHTQTKQKYTQHAAF
jgi:hypothetical protein